MTDPYRVILADPPWLFGDHLPGKGRGASKNYRVMGVSDIMRFPLPPIADDALLIMWRVSSMVEEAYQVVRAWDFVPKSEIVWEKTTKTGKPWFGMGRYVRNAHETAIVATRGRFKVADRSVRSRFSAPAFKERHSKKPDEIFSIAKRLAGGRGPFLELFGREQRALFDVIGDEMPGGFAPALPEAA